MKPGFSPTAHALCEAGAMLLDPQTPQGLALRQAVAQRQGHHPATIERALRDSFADLERRIEALVHSQPPGDAIDAHALVLAGNVFTQAFRPLAVSLLAGVRTRVKPASPGDPFAELLWSALTAANPKVGALMKVERFSSDDGAAFDDFVRDAELVSVYGASTSIDAIGHRLRKAQRLSAHGPGFGAIALDAHDLEDLAARCDAIADDIVAYDQAGCLSPHVIWLCASQNDAHDFAEALNVALEDRADTVAHRMTTSTAVEALRWRAAAAADTLLGEPSHAIWLRRGGAFRPSPGHRHITIGVVSEAERNEALHAAGSLLKTLAVVDDGSDRPLARHAVFQRDEPPRLSHVGQMQAPPLDHIWDGRSLWAELIRA